MLIKPMHFSGRQINYNVQGLNKVPKDTGLNYKRDFMIDVYFKA